MQAEFEGEKNEKYGEWREAWGCLKIGDVRSAAPVSCSVVALCNVDGHTLHIPYLKLTIPVWSSHQMIQSAVFFVLSRLLILFFGDCPDLVKTVDTDS